MLLDVGAEKGVTCGSGRGCSGCARELSLSVLDGSLFGKNPMRRRESESRVSRYMGVRDILRKADFTVELTSKKPP